MLRLQLNLLIVAKTTTAQQQRLMPLSSASSCSRTESFRVSPTACTREEAVRLFIKQLAHISFGPAREFKLGRTH